MMVEIREKLISEIQWHDGMLLMPQHFQRQARRFDQLISYHTGYLNPYHYGLINLQLDTTTLPSGLIRVLNLEAVMPDHMIIQYAQQNQHPLEIDISDQKEALINGWAYLYICVPQSLQGISPVSGEWPRYRSEANSHIEDENVTENIIEIPELQPLLSLFIGKEPPHRYTAMPIAKLTFQDESFIEESDYSPPRLVIDHNTRFGKKCLHIVQRLREKISYLSSKWHNQSSAAMIGETANVLKPLLRSLPGLEAIMHSPSHPFDIYLRLCDLTGQLAELKIGQVPPLTPSYNHLDINSCFNTIFETVHYLVDSIEQTYIVQQFSQRERLFSALLKTAQLSEALLIGFRAPAHMSEEELNEWVNDCVICSDSAVRICRDRRITGAPRAIITDKKLFDLLPGRGTLIYKVDIDPDFIKDEENLNIFNAADTTELRPSEIVLYTRRVSLTGEGQT